MDGGILAFSSRWAFEDFCMLLGNTVVSAFLYHNIKLAIGAASSAYIRPEAVCLVAGTIASFNAIEPAAAALMVPTQVWHL